jgi:hypothetical protein
LFLGFSSLSIILQLFSCIYTNNFKLKILIKGKLLHGILSCIITYILVNIPIVYQYINTSKTVNNTIDKEFEMKVCNEPETIKISDCNPKAQPCVLTNHGIDTNVVKFD